MRRALRFRHCAILRVLRRVPRAWFAPSNSSITANSSRPVGHVWWMAWRWSTTRRKCVTPAGWPLSCYSAIISAIACRLASGFVRRILGFRPFSNTCVAATSGWRPQLPGAIWRWRAFCAGFAIAPAKAGAAAVCTMSRWPLPNWWCTPLIPSWRPATRGRRCARSIAWARWPSSDPASLA